MIFGLPFNGSRSILPGVQDEVASLAGIEKRVEFGAKGHHATAAWALDFVGDYFWYLLFFKGCCCHASGYGADSYNGAGTPG
jgi:hypothetical protein